MPSGSLYSFGAILLVLLLGDPSPTNQARAFVHEPPFQRTPSTRTAPLKASLMSDHEGMTTTNDRRGFLAASLLLTTSVVSLPQAAVAADPKPKKKRYVLDEETGDYVEVEEDEKDWQTEWKSRYDTMSTMSRDEIFTAARGAGNIDSKDLANESPASKKRRAFSGCRDKATRAKLDNIDEKVCSKRVLEGDVDFVLEVL